MGIVGPTVPPAGSVGTEQLAEEAVTNAKLATGAVGGTKINSEAVTYAKIIKPESNPPAKGANGTASGGFRNPSSHINFSIVGDGAKTAFTLKHELKTFEAVDVAVYETAAEKPTKPLLNAAGAGNFTYKIIDAENLEVIFGTAPTAGTMFVAKVTI